MKYLIIFLIVWLIIAWVYSKVKKHGFLKANKLMLIGILKFVFDKNASRQEMKWEAKKAGREDVVERIEQQQNMAISMSEQLKDREKNLKE